MGYIAIGVFVVLLLVLIWDFIHAPEGYQDAEEFHFGKPKR